MLVLPELLGCQGLDGALDDALIIVRHLMGGSKSRICGLERKDTPLWQQRQQQQQRQPQQQRQRQQRQRWRTGPHRADGLHEGGLLREAHAECDHADQQLLPVKVVLPRVLHLRAVLWQHRLHSDTSCRQL